MFVYYGKESFKGRRAGEIYRADFANTTGDNAAWTQSSLPGGSGDPTWRLTSLQSVASLGQHYSFVNSAGDYSENNTDGNIPKCGAESYAEGEACTDAEPTSSAILRCVVIGSGVFGIGFHKSIGSRYRVSFSDGLSLWSMV